MTAPRTVKEAYHAARNQRAAELEQLARELLDPTAGESASWIITGWPDGHTCREWLTVRPLEAGRRLRDVAAYRWLITATSSHADRMDITP